MANTQTTHATRRPSPALRLIKTTDLHRDQWLDVRRSGIGSSDAAAAVLEGAKAVVTEMAAKSPVAIGICKDLMNDVAALPTAEGLDKEAKAFRAAFATEDKAEGVRAFVAKDKPTFPGR